MTTMKSYIIFIPFKNVACYFIRPSFWCIATLVFELFHVKKEEWIILEVMQNSQPHINLYRADIFFSWGYIMLRSEESLMMILLSASSASFSPPSSVGITGLL